MPPRNLKILESLLEVADSRQTLEDFKEAFQRVIAMIATMKADIESRSETLDAQVLVTLERAVKIAAEKASSLALEETSQKLALADGEHQKRIHNLTDSLKKTVALSSLEMERMKKDHASKMAEMEKRASALRNGKDADEARVAEMIMEKISLPSLPNLEQDLPKFGEPIRDALELLGGENRLDAQAIKGLKEELLTLQSEIQRVGRTRVLAGPHGFRGGADFSFAGDGSTTSFTLPKAPGLHGKAIWVYYNSAWLVPDTHFQVNGKTLTSLFVAGENTTIDGMVFW